MSKMNLLEQRLLHKEVKELEETLKQCGVLINNALAKYKIGIMPKEQAELVNTWLDKISLTKVRYYAGYAPGGQTMSQTIPEVLEEVLRKHVVTEFLQTIEDMQFAIGDLENR